MSYTDYITKAGDRWDLIAYKAYGSVDKMGEVIRANPDIPVTDELSEGLLLKIPIIEEVTVKTDKELLPPWLR